MATPGTLVLLAHGDLRRRSTRPFHSALLARTGVTGRKPRLAYIGAASEDDPGYAGALTRFFADRGAECTHVVTTGPHALDRADAVRALERADLIYLGGGDVELCVRVLSARGLDEVLRARHAAGTLLAAASAGSIALCAWWVNFPDTVPEPPPPHEGAALFPCLRVAPDLLCDTHAEDDDWDELRVALALLAERDGEERWVGWGIPSNGALEIAPGGPPRSIGPDPCVRLRVRSGEVVPA